MTWGGIKKGDGVIEVYCLGTRHEARYRSHVKSAGTKWLVTSGGKRYQACNGYGEYGWHLHTEETLDDTIRREAAWKTIRNIPGGRGPDVPLAALEAFAKVIAAAAGGAS